MVVHVKICHREDFLLPCDETEFSLKGLKTLHFGSINVEKPNLSLTAPTCKSSNPAAIFVGYRASFKMSSSRKLFRGIPSANLYSSMW